MASAERAIQVYRELAICHEERREAQMRDRFLVLAADAAQTAGQVDQAERLRERLLHFNPHHMLKPYASLAEALKSIDVQNYVTALRRSHSIESSERLLQTLHGAGIAKANSRSRADISPVDDPARAMADTRPVEELKVYPMRDGESPRSPAPIWEVPSMHAASKSKSAAAVTAPTPRPVTPAARSAPVRDVYTLRPEPASPSASIEELEDKGGPDGAWLCSVLFTLLLAAGLALLVHTLGSPFLPR